MDWPQGQRAKGNELESSIQDPTRLPDGEHLALIVVCDLCFQLVWLSQSDLCWKEGKTLRGRGSQHKV